jgi:hypothetical protein
LKVAVFGPCDYALHSHYDERDFRSSKAAGSIIKAMRNSYWWAPDK